MDEYGGGWRASVPEVLLTRNSHWAKLSWLEGKEGEIGEVREEQGKKEIGSLTPLTILDPTRVICPFTHSLLGLLITRVDPGSIGANKA